MKDKPIAETAQAVASHGERCSEDIMRRLDRMGVVKPTRDPWGRRLFGDDDVIAARNYLRSKRSKASAA